jgi:hypothetical protein
MGGSEQEKRLLDGENSSDEQNNGKVIVCAPRACRCTPYICSHLSRSPPFLLIIISVCVCLSVCLYPFSHVRHMQLRTDIQRNGTVQQAGGHDNTEATDETESSEKAALWRVFFCAVVATLCNIAFGCVRPRRASSLCITHMHPAALLPEPSPASCSLRESGGLQFLRIGRADADLVIHAS